LPPTSWPAEATKACFSTSKGALPWLSEPIICNGR
jgi:hypothetical protein